MKRSDLGDSWRLTIMLMFWKIISGKLELLRKLKKIRLLFDFKMRRKLR